MYVSNTLLIIEYSTIRRARAAMTGYSSCLAGSCLAAFLVSLFPLFVAKPLGDGGIRPKNAPKALDCAMRKISIEFAEQLFPGRGVGDVADAMQFSNLCPNSSMPRQRAAPRTSDKASQPDPSKRQFFADANRGDDISGDGSQAKPFKSIHRALTAARDFPKTPRTIILRNGTYFVGSTILLTDVDSFVEIVSFQGERAVISGGEIIEPNWQPVGSAMPGVFVSSVAIDYTPTELFVEGRREIRARFPNGDPETCGSHNPDMPPCWFEGGSWSDDNQPSGSEKEYKVEIKSATRPGPQFNEFSMTFGGLTERYMPSQSFW